MFLRGLFINIQKDAYLFIFAQKGFGQILSQFGNDDILKINKNENESTWHLLKGNKITAVNC